MKTLVYKKDFFKESPQIKQALICAVNSLNDKIIAYENINIPFDKIFNDERLKYDKHGKFYTYKYKRDKLQIRILYAYINVNGVNVFIMVDYVIKKKNNTDYITRFSFYKTYDPLTIYQSAIPMF